MDKGTHVQSYLKFHRDKMKDKEKHPLKQDQLKLKRLSLEGHKTSFGKKEIRNNTPSNRRAQVQDLPDEILFEIFSFLEIHDLISASQVCSRWNSISNDNVLWRPILQKFASGMVDELKVKKTDTGTRNAIKQLCLKRCVTLRNKWLLCNKVLKKKHPYTYTTPTSEMEKLVKLAGITWQLVLCDNSNKEHVLYSHDTTWHQMTLTLRWFSLQSVLLRNVKSVSLYSCNPVFFDQSTKQAVRNGPYQRSLLLKFDLKWRSWVEKNKPIGGDDLIDVYSLPNGAMVTTWKSDGELAFISLSLPVHRLLHRCLKGTSSEPYCLSERKPHKDDVDPSYGLHGYMCTVQLRTMKASIWDQQFRGLDCKRGNLGGFAVFTLLQTHERQIINKEIVLPWKTDAFRGKVKGVCWCDVIMTDETGEIFWVASAPVSAKSTVQQAVSNLDFDYEYNDTKSLDLVDDNGSFHMEIAQTDRKDAFITFACIKVSLSAINNRFGTSYG